jgi:hypothetical protein
MLSTFQSSKESGQRPSQVSEDGKVALIDIKPPVQKFGDEHSLRKVIPGFLPLQSVQS